MQRAAFRARQLSWRHSRRTMSSSSSGPKLSLQRAVELGFVGAAAIVGGSYITWHILNGKRKIAMEALDAGDLRPSQLTPLSLIKENLSSTREPSPIKSPTVASSPSGEDESPSSTEQSDGESSAPEEETSGAFNPITGEINWDCPCLGGMAYGPCGQQFRDAFSCFVYSEEEPKGINCVDKFKLMQDCFREHPDIYAEEIADDDNADEPTDDRPVDLPPESASSPPLSEDTVDSIPHP